MKLIADSAESRYASLCLLGAGNCNGVDLGRLVNRFREIHLVDVDQDALT